MYITVVQLYLVHFYILKTLHYLCSYIHCNKPHFESSFGDDGNLFHCEVSFAIVSEENFDSQASAQARVAEALGHLAA